jgi:hypothetical protein
VIVVKNGLDSAMLTGGLRISSGERFRKRAVRR